MKLPRLHSGLILWVLVSSTGCVPGGFGFETTSLDVWFEQLMTGHLGRKVEVEGIQAGLDGAVKIQGFSVAGTEGGAALKIDEISASLGLAEVMTGVVTLQDLVLTRPRLDASSPAHLSSWFRELADRISSPVQGASFMALTPRLVSLRVIGGRIELANPAVRIEELAAELTPMEKGVRLDRIRLSVGEGESTQVSIESMVIRSGDSGWKTDPFSVRLGDLPLSGTLAVGGGSSPILTGELLSDDVDLGGWLNRAGTELTRLDLELNGRVKIRLGVGKSGATVISAVPRSGKFRLPGGKSAKVILIKSGGVVEIEGSGVRLGDVSLESGGDLAIVRGLLTPIKGGVEISGGRLKKDGAVTTLEGRIRFGPPVTLDLRVEGAMASAGSSSMPLSLEGGGLRLEGPADNPRISGRFRLAGADPKRLGLSPGMRIETGSLVVRGSTGDLENVVLLDGDSRFAVTGRITGLSGTPKLNDVRVSGTVGPQSLRRDSGILGAASLTGVLSGTTHAPLFTGSLRSNELQIPMGGQLIVVRAIEGRMRRDASGVILTPVTGSILGGQLGATVRIPAVGVPVYKIQIKGWDLPGFLKMNHIDMFITQGGLDIWLDVSGAGASATGKGILWLANVGLDGRRIPAVQQARRALEKSQATSSLLTLLVGTATGGLGGAIGGAMASRLVGSREFINAVDRTHDMGDTRIDFTFDSQEINFHQIQGDCIQGSMKIRRSDSFLNGRLDTLRLTTALARNIGIRGPLSSPEMSLDGGDPKIVPTQTPLHSTRRPQELNGPVPGPGIPAPLPNLDGLTGSELLDVFRGTIPGAERKRPASAPRNRVRPPGRKKRSTPEASSGTPRGQSILDSIR